MTIRRGTPQPNGEFGPRVAAALAGKGIHAPEPIVVAAAERIIPAPRRNGALRFLTGDTFIPSRIHTDTPTVVQQLLAYLDRHGVTGIGLPLCPACRTAKVVKVRDEQGRRICFRCAQLSAYGECPCCLRRKKLVATDPEGRRVCQRCGPDGAPTFECTACAKTVTVASRVDGQWHCLNCYPKRTRRCVSCGQDKKIATTILTGPHCFACHNRVLRNPAPCPGCGRIRILAFLDDTTTACAGCSGQPARYACRRCGSEEHYYGRLCARCSLDDRCTELLVGPDGTFSEPMRALREHLLARPRPAQLITWLRRGPHIDLLGEIASGQAPLTAASFVRPGGDKSLDHLYALLVEAGAIPRDRATADLLEAWTARTIADAPAGHRRLLTPYARWVLLRRASSDRRTGDITSGAAKHVKAATRGLITFLTWLDEHDTSLDAVTQGQVEQFLAVRSAQRWLPQFLGWAHERGLAPQLEVPVLTPGLPNITASERDHEHTIATLIRDDAIALDVRLPSLLIAVYGVPASRILTLRREQLHDTGEAIDLNLGDRPLRLPEPLADLARTHLARHPEAGPQDWLFPGRQPGRPRNALYLTRQLRMLGTSISALQKTARFRLAGAVPAKVLADMLGFHVNTFETYAHLAAGNRGDYPSLRKRDVSDAGTTEPR